MSSTQTTQPATGTAPVVPPPQRHRIRTTIIFLLVVGVVGFIIWRIVTANDKANKQAAAQQAAMANRAIPVQVATVQEKAMPIYVTALGTVSPYYSVTVKPRVTGELIRVNFKEGQDVHQGEELMTIDPRPYQATLDQAKGQLAKDQAQLQNAQAEYDRYKALFDQGVVSKETLDAQAANFGNYEGAIKADQAAIDADALNVQYCHITSPITGKIGLRLVDPGNVVTANTTNLIVINQFQPIAVLFTLPEDQLPRVFAKMSGARALQAEAYDRSDTIHIASGQLLTADNQIDTTTGTGKLKAVFPNKDEQLFPNQFVNVHLVLETRPDAITAPTAAVQHGTDGDFVWIVKPDKTVAVQPVKVDVTEGTTVIFSDGLKPGDQVVTDGADKLREGTKVDARPMTHNRPATQSGNGSNGMMGQ
ncbi:MAG TPA: MdtA/MuxA family multidrug efflux RND transporter periplasmic adaptor subunit [Pseudacidobacterium sp.]|nr:MdtA/MuxA family multidrug efflux RND transporter periplasmic adaptor subunit [Pseudacidobacterium sp.]